MKLFNILYFYFVDTLYRWYPTQPGLDSLMGSIKAQFREPWPTWGHIPQEVRDQWWKNFQVIN